MMKHVDYTKSENGTSIVTIHIADMLRNYIDAKIKNWDDMTIIIERSTGRMKPNLALRNWLKSISSHIATEDFWMDDKVIIQVDIGDFVELTCPYAYSEESEHEYLNKILQYLKSNCNTCHRQHWILI